MSACKFQLAQTPIPRPQTLNPKPPKQAKLQGVQQSLEDLNENRLDKFEVALLMTKVMEDFLDSDIQYNFVEHFRSSDPLLPKGFAPALIMETCLILLSYGCLFAMMKLC
jgi:hypothetical protein